MNYFLTKEDKIKISNNIINDTKVTLYYYIMIILSCTVATYGLLSNSTAVIIGAMLISPLMSPIIGGALGASENNNELLKSAIKTEILGAIIAIILSVFLTLLIPEKVLTAEIIARTKPTLLDLIIALASGAAGTYAICYKPNSAILPGVAISTALMPPLCVVGIGVANKEFSVAWGAFLLFLANIIAINFSSILIFNIFGFKKIHSGDGENKLLFNRFSNNVVYSVVLLLLISIPLIIFMFNSLQDNRVNNTVRSTIQEEMDRIAPNTQIVSISSDKLEKAYMIDTVIRSTKALTNENIRTIENILEYKLTKPVKLNADIVLVQKISESNSINGYNDFFSELNSALNKDQTVEVVKVQSPEEIIEGTIEEKLSLFPGAAVENFWTKYEKNAGIYYIDVLINYNEDIDSKLEKSIISVLEEKLKRKVVLTIQKTSDLVEPSGDPTVDEDNDKDTESTPDPSATAAPDTNTN